MIGRGFFAQPHDRGDADQAIGKAWAVAQRRGELCRSSGRIHHEIGGDGERCVTYADLDGMARSAVALLTDPVLHRRVAAAAHEKVSSRFCEEKIVPLYEAFYEEVLAERVGQAGRAGKAGKA